MTFLHELNFLLGLRPELFQQLHPEPSLLTTLRFRTYCLLCSPRSSYFEIGKNLPPIKELIIPSLCWGRNTILDLTYSLLLKDLFPGSRVLCCPSSPPTTLALHCCGRQRWQNTIHFVLD